MGEAIKVGVGASIFNTWDEYVMICWQVSTNSFGEIQEQVPREEVLLFESEPDRTTEDRRPTLKLADPHETYGSLAAQLEKGLW